MQGSIFRSIIFPFLLISILSSCVNVTVKGEPETVLEITPDLQATAKAMLEEAGSGEELSTIEKVEQALPQATATIPPAPTATQYIPEGQLAYFNFEDLEQGWEKKRGEGITLRKPDTFGIEIAVERDVDYHLATGVVGHPDGNISTYVFNISPPDESVAFISCRVEIGEYSTDEFESSAKSEYRAEFRFDGRARIVKKVNEKESILADWTTVTSMNPEGVYDQLYLLCDGPRLLFMVNATPVFDLQDNTLTEGDFAIGVGRNPNRGETVIRFDKVAVFEP